MLTQTFLQALRLFTAIAKSPLPDLFDFNPFLTMAVVTSHTKTPKRSAPEFDLLGVDGGQHTLQNFKDKTGLAVIFTCNHCPYAVASRPVIVDLANEYPDIGFVCISSNDADYVPADGYEHMQKLSQELRLPFPYLYDEDQSIAKAYDAQCTPDNYLFKNAGESFELFFHGRFTDNRQDPSKVTEKNFEEHITKLLDHQEPADTRPPSMGCSIKWK